MNEFKFKDTEMIFFNRQLLPFLSQWNVRSALNVHAYNVINILYEQYAHVQTRILNANFVTRISPYTQSEQSRRRNKYLDGSSLFQTRLGCKKICNKSKILLKITGNNLAVCKYRYDITQYICTRGVD